MRRSTLVVASIGLLCGCGTDPEDSEIAAYQLYFIASGGDTTSERVRAYDCSITGHFTVPAPVEPAGTVEVPLMISRTLADQSGKHREFTSADTVIQAALLAYDGLGEQTLSFTISAGPYTLTPASGSFVASYAQYDGAWTCGPDLPLAQDSTLLAYGYDPAVEIAGTWQVFENLPIE